MVRDWPSWLTLLVDGLATYRLTRLIVRDDFPPIKKLRDWMLRRWPAADVEYATADIDDGYVRGTRTAVRALRIENEQYVYGPEHPSWIGDLITCPWCAGMYAAAGVVAMHEFVFWWPWLALVLALSAVAGLLSLRD